MDELVLTAQEIQQLTPEQAWHYNIVPVPVHTAEADFFIDEESNQSDTAEELELILGKPVQFIVKPSPTIRKWLSTFYRKEQETQESSGGVLQYTSGSDDFLTRLIVEAQSIRSSDIHLEIYEQKCRVRIRIDGMLVERFIIEREHYPSLVNRIKIMAHMDISEKRLPQDGRIFFQTTTEKFDIRVSVLPTLYGEKIVMRLLSQNATNISIEKLGFEQDTLTAYLQGTRRKQGLILISGPTGSGKTTTLYATLKLLNEDTRNVLTIEDPVEYTLPGINQVQLKENIGLNFGVTLRTFLRQDPDVIMVGEIRDEDTANMAIRLAQTGHLVLSTIHTNSAWGTVFRLVDMGVPAFLLAGTLSSSVAQRLVRLLCPACKQKQVFNPGEYPKAFKAPFAVEYHYTSKGCEACYYTGYKGRKAIYEVIPIDQEMSECIKNTIFDVSAQLKERNIKTLSDNAFNLFAEGETSLDEIYSLLVNF
ncbi:MAG: GspE/PulE family protein [Cytophaga sp.]|uniref:GspE/PulE family protein n=1 Tax=Cytophaga sp. TaxID=29535 RepID=UPI003F7D3FE7